MVLYVFIHTNVEIFIKDKFVFLSVLYEAFHKSAFFTSVTSLILIFSWIFFAFSTIKDRNIPLNKIIIEVIGIEVLLLADSGWATPNSGFGGFSLCSLTVLLLVLDIGLFCIKWLFYQKYETSKTFKDSFIVDNHKVQNIDKTREQYAISLLKRLRNVDNTDEAFSLVIYGEWGSGKTLFLRCIEKQLRKHNDILINFNPWNNHSTKQMLISFFENLSRVLSEYDSSLKKPIIKYADVVTSLDMPKPFDVLASSVFGKGELSTDGLKDKIRHSLNLIGRGVYVLIDDLDRLTRSEILNVLCLIRNTANFPHLKYIVACDRNHIVAQLKGLDITPNYLEKIFMMELYLPKIYQGYPCVERCKEAIMAMTDDIALNNFFVLMAKNTLDLLEKSLKNLRQSERFARGLVLNWTFVCRKSKGQFKEINIAAFLWLELIRVLDEELYEKLYSDPCKYFSVKKHKKYNQDMYVLRSDDELDKIIENKCLLAILNTMFPYNEYFPLPQDSISLLENYDKYFCLGMAYGHISKTKFLQLMNSDNIDTLMDGLSSQEKDSFFNMLLMLDLRKMNSKLICRYFDFILLYYRMYGDSFPDNLLFNLLNMLSNQPNDNDVKNYIIHCLTNNKGSYKQMLSVNLICNKLIRKIHETDSKFLEEEKLRTIVQSNFLRCIEDYQYDAADIINSHSPLYDLVKSSVVCYITKYDDKSCCYEYETLIHSQILDAFENHKSTKKQKIKDFESIGFDKEFSEESLDYLADSKEYEICELFGNRDNYKEYKEKCFTYNE